MRGRGLLVIVLTLILVWLAGGAAFMKAEPLPGAVREIDATDYPSIQAALDAVAATGGSVRLPAGTFEISQPLLIRHDDICVHGAGTASHIKNTNTDGLPAIVIAHRDHPRDGNTRESELWRVRSANFRVTGNPESGDGIVAHNVNEVFVDGMSISHHGGDGLELSYCYEDPGSGLNRLPRNKNEAVGPCHRLDSFCQLLFQPARHLASAAPRYKAQK